MAATFGSAQLDDDIVNAPAPEAGEFSKGLRSGMLGAGSQLQSLAGGVAAAAGADQFAAERNAAAQRLSAEAAAAGPRVTSYKEGFGSLRDFGDYAAGLAGQAVPSIGAGVAAGGLVAATGGGAIPALLAGAAVNAPLEIGDVLQRQQLDPQARLRGAGDNLGRAAVAGGLSSLGQAIVPAALGGRLVGKGVQGALRTAEKEGVKQVATGGITRAMLRDAAIEGASEGGGELVKQQGTQLGGPVDWQAATEAAVGGAVVGAPLGGAGHAADTFHENRSTMGEGVKKAAGAVKDAAGPAVKDFGAKIREAITPRARDEDLAGQGDLAGLSPEETAEVTTPGTARERLMELLNKGAEMATGATKRVAERFAQAEDVAPEARQRFAEAASTAGDAATQAWVKTEGARESARQKIEGLASDVISGLGSLKKRFGEKDEGTKKSEDFSGVRGEITKTIASYLPEEIMGNDRAIGQVGEAVRQYIDAVKTTDVKAMEEVTKKMHAIFGDSTEEVLSKVYDTVETTSPEETQKFIKATRYGTQLAARDKSVYTAVEENLPEGFAGDSRALADGLMDWARGNGRASNNRAMAPEIHSQVRRQIEQVFGKNAPKVFKALESNALGENAVPGEGRAAKVSESDEENAARAEIGTAEQGTDYDFYGTGKDRTQHKVFDSPASHRNRFPDAKTGTTGAEVLMKKLSAQYPDREVTFVPLSEAAQQLGWSPERVEALADGRDPKDLGLVATQRVADPDTLGDTQAAKMKLDKSKHANSPAKFDIGGTTYDAVAVSKHFLKNGQGTESKSGDARLARAFFEGAAALQTRDLAAAETRLDAARDERVPNDVKIKALEAQVELLKGGFKGLEIADSTVIGYQNGKPFTFGDAKAIDPRGPEDLKVAKDRAAIKERMAFLKDEAAKERDPDQLDRIKERIAELTEEAKAYHAEGVLKGEKREDDKTDILDGRHEVDQATGNIHELAATGGVKEVNYNSDGTPRAPAEGAVTRQAREAQEKVQAFAEKLSGAKSEAAQTAGRRLEVLAGAIDSMSDADRRDLIQLTNATKVSEVAEQINALARKYKDVVVAPSVKSDGDALSPEARERAAAKAAPKEEDPQDPKAPAAKKAALIKAASSSDPALLNELSTTSDALALQRTVQHLNDAAPGADAAITAANTRLGELQHDADAAYSMQAVNQAKGRSAQDIKDVNDILSKSLGNSVAVQWKKMGHAGEFVRTKTGDVIRVSVHALNPKSVAYHESLHAFFQQLRDAGAQKVFQVLEKAASQPHVRRWMENHFKNEPGVLKQLRGDAEERAAYMYQLWATEPAFRAVLNPQATTFFGKVAEFLRSVTGIWSNDQRALHIMEHFQSGEYAKNIGKPNVVSLLGSGTNRAVEQFSAMASPLAQLGDVVFGAGSARLRDTGNNAINKIADLIKPTIAGSETTDPGYVAASRQEFTARLNKFGEDLGPLNEKQRAEVLEALQTKQAAPSPEARLAVRKVHETLRSLYDYLTTDAGVPLGDQGKDYFPRVWDAHTISANPKAFLTMMEPYVRSGQYKGDPKNLLRTLVANDGNNFDVDTRQPGFQSGKERSLDFIVDTDAAPFLSKDLYHTMSSYISQATRRGEWAKRFGHDGRGLDSLVSQAEKDGASADDLRMINSYVKGVTGTLGDGINPEARRLMGNAIVYQNIRLLPLAIFSSVVDPMGIMVRGGSVSDAFEAFKRGVREIPLNFKKYDASARDTATLLAETLGVIENSSLQQSLGALYSQGMVGSLGRKINDTFFRYNLMEQYNRSMRVGATEAALKFIERHAAGADPQHSKRWMDELGLAPADVQMAGGRMKLTEADGLTPEHADRMRAAVNKWVDGAILRPDAADKPIWFNDPHWALISHLKQFTYAFQHTIINRVVREAQEGNYKPAAYLAAYVPVMIAADFIKGMAQGGGEQPAWKKGWGVDDYLWSGVQRAGLFGVGQIGVDAATDIHRGGSGFGALVGPTVEQLTDAGQVVGGKREFDSFALDAMPANALYKNLNVGE